MAKVMGIVNLHHSINLDSITTRRSLASTAFLGRYCFIDFAISNFTNSGINEIGILIKEHSRSLFRHLGSGDSQWALNTKTGGITLMYNEQYANNNRYNHDVNRVWDSTSAPSSWPLRIAPPPWPVPTISRSRFPL